MNVPSRHREGITILEPKGKITIGEGDVALRNAIHEALDAGATKLLLNMAGVTRLDSSGIAELVQAHSTAASRGASLKLTSLTKKVKDVLDITQIVGLFEAFDDEDAAVASFE